MVAVASRGLGRMLVLAVLLALPRAAEAGPPLVCRPFDAGGAALLPWGDGPGWNAPARSYDVRHLTADTLRLLSADAPVLARMENLRRATIYASRDGRIAAELLAAVLGRAVTAAAEGRGEALPWFDAGHLLESYRQAESAFRGERRGFAFWRTRPSLPIGPELPDGYRLVQRALQLAGPSPEMEFAASLMTTGAASAEHGRRASDGAAAGSLLAKNLAR